MRFAHIPVLALTIPIIVVSATGFARAAQPPPPPDPTLEELAELEFEELIRIPIRPVITVAGVERELVETPTAMTVVTTEDIRRTGHRSLAEAMRLVPGMYVGRSGSHSWRIGPRGFSGGLAPRNLVLIDGRTVYDPLHGGVFWDVLDVVFEDLDHIEVIRGPGATLWGANAMNGVINVITKSAHDTQGLYLAGGGGTYERAFTTVRYGDKIDEDTAFRVYGKYFHRDRFREGTSPAHDDWSILRGGFRLDRNIDPDTTFTVISEGYGALTMGETVTVAPGVFEGRDQQLSGAHALARLAHQTADRVGWSLQTYYDRTNRDQHAIEVRRDTFDVDFRNFFPWGDDHEFIWGVGYRFTTDRTEPGPTLTVDPRGRSLNLFSGFVQNSFTLVPDRLFAMLGTKLHHHTYTGFDVQPGARLWWTPDERQTIWGAISRPVRIPSRLEEDGTLAGIVLPGEDLDAEELIAYEVGYRVSPAQDVTLDVTLFYHDYRKLIGISPDIFATPAVPSPWVDDARGESFGVEVGADWRVAENWRLGGGYSFQRSHVHGPVLPFDETDVPQHQAFVRSHFDITRNWFFDTVVYYYDHLPARPGRAKVPSYVRLDLGLTWRVSESFDVSIWGQNVTSRSTAEGTTAREFPRGVYLMGAIRY